MRSLSKQTGISLISLIIGALISSLMLMAITSVYFKINVFSKQIKLDSETEGNISFLLLNIQQQFQNSGYRLENSDHIDFEKKEGLYQIFWRYIDPATDELVCMSLHEVNTTITNNINAIDIQFFTPTNTCNLNVPLKQMVWDKYEYTLLRFNERTKSIFNNISINNKKCTPYMIGNENQIHKTINITIETTIENINHDISMCLVNL